MKKILFLLAAVLLTSAATAQTQTAYLDLYQRGGGQHLRTTLIFDSNPIKLKRHNLGETLNMLASLGWEVDKTLIGANRIMVFPTRHKFHIILKKEFRAGENPFEGLRELQDNSDDTDYTVHSRHETVNNRRTDADKSAAAEKRVRTAKTSVATFRQLQPAANNEIRYMTYKKSPVKANISQHHDFSGNVYLYDEHGIISFKHDITEIPANAFQGCRELKTVVIPASVAFIGDAAFAGCSNLTYLYCMAVTPPKLGDNAALISRYCKICVPAEAAEAYKTAEGWSAYADRITGYHSGR